MSDKTRSAISVPTTYRSQQIDDKWIKWIEDALKTLNDDTAEKIVYELEIQRAVHSCDNIIKFYGITTEIRNNSPKKYMLLAQYYVYMRRILFIVTCTPATCLRERPIPNTPKDYEKIYTDCWKDKPDDRPDIEEIVTRLETIIAENDSTKDIQSYDSNSYVQKPPKPLSIIEKNNSTKDFQSYDFNSYVQKPLKPHSRLETIIAKNNSTKDFQSYDFNSYVQKPPKPLSIIEKNNSTKDFQSYDFNSYVQKPLKPHLRLETIIAKNNSTKDSQSYGFNSEPLRPHSRLETIIAKNNSTKDSQSYDFNSDVQKPLRPLSNFAKDFYSYSSDDDIEQLIKMISNNP
ncbi:unnamed protein product [Rhizophagus irregularis]|uniref:Serine-threonine/tyrosine-protein kinase catalytic domain-containing protein n=1 Tax=Rhizophagus irregularis TaxID=588596 RepID=A0A915Z2D4_9GLOM|nr:unnamed protein product [Rhizophagus irregularis]CAB5359819.1 unnamed protein product [Rhizophagus irregularis]